MKEELVALICRHGSTELNEADCYRSLVDVPLSTLGLQQAKEAAAFLKKYPIKQIMCSPLLRAFITADLISKDHNLFVSQTRGLFPWQLGIFSGLSKKMAKTALHLFVDNPEVQIPNGESLNDFEDRSFAFFEAALKQAKGKGLVLFVAHTSNVISIVKSTEETSSYSPEFDETVKPGGIAEIYWDGKHHFVKPVFGAAMEAEFGGS